MVDRRQHWETVYRGKATDQLSRFQPHAASPLHRSPRGGEQEFVYGYCRRA